MPEPSVQRRHAELVAASVRGDRAAFRQLYDLFVHDVHRQAARMVGWGAAAEDVTQEVFIAMHRALPTYRGDSELGTWLFRLTRNVTISWLRRRGPAAVDLAGVRALAAWTQEPDLDARRQVAALQAALEGIALEAREAFILFELEGKTLAEIAELSGEPLHTVASRVRRARERLRELVERAATPAAAARRAR